MLVAIRFRTVKMNSVVDPDALRISDGCKVGITLFVAVWLVFF